MTVIFKESFSTISCLIKESLTRIYYIRLMARAALYKWITSPDQIDLPELDKMINKHPFAQNLQILKALAGGEPINHIVGQSNSLQTSWFQYRLEERNKSFHRDESLASDIEEAMPIHVSDSEHNIETIPDQKLLICDLSDDEPIEAVVEEENLDWMTSDTIIDSDLTEELFFINPRSIDEVEEPRIEMASDTIEDTHIEDPHVEDTHFVDVLEKDLQVKDFNNDIYEVTEVKEENSVTTNQVEPVLVEVESKELTKSILQTESDFRDWLLSLNPVTAPAPIILPVDDGMSYKDIIINSVEDKPLEMNKSVEEIIVNTQAVEIKETTAAKEVKEKSIKRKKKLVKAKKSKKSKKKNKKVKSKQLSKNKKLTQKLRKRKKKIEALRSKKNQLEKQLKKVAKLKAAEKKKRKKYKKSQGSIEAILKNKASKKGKKKRSGGIKEDRRSSDKSLKKGNFDPRLASEPLANLLWLQGHKKKAIRMFEDLSLKMPEKKAYFASQIVKLKKKNK